MIVTAIVRRAHGAPVLLAQVGCDERDARRKAWVACRLQGIHGFRIDTVPGPWRAAA